MSRESLFPFLPAALAAVSDVLTAGIVVAHQPDYPATVVVYQVVMFGAALLAAVPRKSVQFVGLVTLLAGVAITALSVGVSSDALCGCVVDGEGWPGARSARAG